MPRQRTHYHAASFFQWVPVFRDLSVSPSTKLVGLALATYATSRDGSNAHPGIAELMCATGYGSRTTIVKALAELKTAGLIHQTYAARKGGRSKLADEYQLTLHDDLRRAAGHKPCECGGQ